MCSCRFVGENRQRRFFDEQGLGAGLAGPGRKIRQGATLTKTGAAEWKIGSADFSTNRGWTGRARQENSSGGHADEKRGCRVENRQRRFFDEQGLDAGLGQAGKFVRGAR